MCVSPSTEDVEIIAPAVDVFKIPSRLGIPDDEMLVMQYNQATSNFLIITFAMY